MSNVLDGNALFRDLMALNAAFAAMYRNIPPPTRPDAEAIPGRDALDSDELVDGGAVHPVSQGGGE